MKILYRSIFIRYLLLLTGCFPLLLYAQTAVIKGKITNIKTGEGLPFASVRANKTNAVTADSLGAFEITTAPGRISLTITLVGYNTYERTIHIADEERLNVQIEMEPRENELDRVVVSGSRQQKSLSREVVSVVSVKPYLIANTNANTLSDVLNKVPGVSVVDGQAIIRGGVGWSYNVGSRVMVLLDDMPLMGPDVGDVQWDLLPIEAAENVEVIKGPSSVLYGSSASSGTVNVRTGWPTNKPQTKLTFFQGVTDNPKNQNSIWWDRTTQPFTSGTFFVHKQKFGQFDLVVSGNANANNSHLQYNDELRFRTYVKTRYRFKKIPGLSAGINGSYMAKKAGRFFIWGNADSAALKPFDGSNGRDLYDIYSIDPHITYVGKSDYTIGVRMRYYHIKRDGDFGASGITRANDAVANMRSLDISFQKRFLGYFSTTSGIYATSFNAVGQVYPGDRTGYSGAAYTQLEFTRKRWSAVAGVRYEINAIGPVEQTQRPLLRFGANYQAASKTFVRMSYGEGFRFPTVGERYVQDKASGLEIFPNPDLKTERGWYTEVGVKQGFNIGQFNASADACIFWMEYENLIEFRFDQYERASYYIDTVNFKIVITGEDKLGFKAVNHPLSRAAGYEVSLEGEGNIGPIGIRTLCGYTYSYPVDANPDSSISNVGNYIKSFFNNYTFIDSGNAALGTLLPYRNRHLVKFDIELSYRKVSIGYNAQYYGIYEKMDDALTYAIPGLKDFQKQSKPGEWVHNARIGMKLSPNMTLALLVNNFSNNTYAIRPAKMDQPRNYNLQLRVVF
jgi:outer membrane cobalamin receptor